MATIRSNSADSNSARVGLSTSSVYPESTATAFEMAARLGYDSLEVMVGIDATSTDVAALKRLVDYHGLPVSAIHAPCLLITQRVWGTDPWAKLERSVQAARELDADVVVVHPPFRWQRDYARGFSDGIERLEADSAITLAVENMFPWRAPARRELMAYAPGWDVAAYDFRHLTLDLSHSSTARQDCVALAQQMGDRLRHLHVTDGTGTAKDEHLVPGTGDQRVAELLQWLAGRGYSGQIVVEINTRRRVDRSAREADLVASLEFTRACFVPTVRAVGPAS